MHARSLSQILGLSSLVVVSDDFPLIVCQTEESCLLGFRLVLVLLQPFFHLSLKVGKKNIVGVGHLLVSDSIECTLKARSLDFVLVSVQNFIESFCSDALHQVVQVVVLKSGD